MFDKILIANRGEIACRVIATARRMGVKTVAVYSDADATARHVAMADEAVRIGPPAVTDSYLKADRIIAAAKDIGAQAIHPGYGFLSENPEFVDAVTAAGLTFIGPSAEAIRAMGLKDAAKALMAQAGVPVVPGYHGAEQDPDVLADEAAKIGYPVMIKARAGGGGKGMRLVEAPADFRPALDGAQREAAASFGDPVCLIEKYIAQPRHIEMQVFGDAHGHVIHLFERDCSLQRRHQKVIEEAPAPDMPADVRAAMGQAAVDAARAIGYHGAGTVEFIADGTGPLRTDGFWFMEMNTRLQVEHPVSEAITSLDFVEMQLRVAAGEPLPVTQDDLVINGWSFEARVYAEDVPAGFLPATGNLHHLTFPRATHFSPGPVRVDSAVRQGDTVTPWYDPMIAKVITHGPTRAAALASLRAALADCHVAGTVTNLAFLSALTGHAGFAAGQVDTGLIARDLEALTAPPPLPDPVLAVAAIAGLGLLEPPADDDPWGALHGWRAWGRATHQLALRRGDDLHDLSVTLRGGDAYALEGIGPVTVRADGAGWARVSCAGLDSRMAYVRHGLRVSIFLESQTYVFDLPDPLARAAEDQLGGDRVIAPMPGLVKVVLAQPGEMVAAGAPLIVLEAMKMEHTLTAPRDGTVAEVLAAVGAQVTDGTLLLTLDTDDA